MVQLGRRYGNKTPLALLNNQGELYALQIMTSTAKKKVLSCHKYIWMRMKSFLVRRKKCFYKQQLEHFIPGKDIHLLLFSPYCTRMLWTWTYTHDVLACLLASVPFIFC